MTEKNLFVELLQLSVGTRDTLSRAPASVEWPYLFDEAQRQAVAGIMVCGLEKLPSNQRPPHDVLFQWIGVCQQIEVQNKLTTTACQQLCKQIEKDGFSVCVLKGQSNYRYYPLEKMNRRGCGDIDVWVVPKADVRWKKADVRKTLDYVDAHWERTGLCWLHCNFNEKSGVPVEVHFRASFMSEPFKNRRFQNHFNDIEHCRTFANVDGEEIPCMKMDEDVIYQMNHIYRHLIDEGVGLRQVVDYYYLLKVWNEQHERSKEERMRIVSHLGMKKFAGALMYVLHELLGMPEEYLLCPASVDDGKFLMNEMLISGNFGHGDPRMGDISIKGGYLRNRVSQALRRFKRNMRFLTSYPGEVIWEPIVRIEHFMWKKLRLWRW